MNNPPINNLNKCVAILMLRTAKLKQDELGYSKKTVVEVEKWFRGLKYEEAIEICHPCAIEIARALELSNSSNFLTSDQQKDLNNVNDIAVLAHYSHVKSKTKATPIILPRPSLHHARLASAAENLRRNIKLIKKAKKVIINGDITRGTVKVEASESEQALLDVDRLDAECLLSHLQGMYKEFKDISSWQEFNSKKSLTNFSTGMLDQLKQISHGLAIKGTCKICESWE